MDICVHVPVVIFATKTLPTPVVFYTRQVLERGNFEGVCGHGQSVASPDFDKARFAL
ncbi:MAG: hypothetical protein ABL907_19100 [Hyphomicrobium sp.]